MGAPGNAPPGCPRRADASAGPRRCGETSCSNHLHDIATSGRPAPRPRIKAQRACDDTCAVDVAERARIACEDRADRRRTREAVSFDVIAILMAMDRRNVIRLFRRAYLKFKARMHRS